jgi:hypothetical protein
VITLRDTIEIGSSPEEVFDFFIHFKENFMAWHPDHVRCWYLEDGPLEEGSTFFVQEFLHKKMMTLEFNVTKLTPYSRIEYRIPPIVEGSFTIGERDSGVLFTAEIFFGTRAPIIGNLIDKMLYTFIGRRLKALKQHMVEEGRNLKMILEKGTQWKNPLAGSA